MVFDTTSPWGTHAPRGLAAFSLRLIDRLPVNGFGKRLAFVLRKPVKKSRHAVFDREVWGLRLRLSTRGNLSEQRWLTMPAFHDPAERAALAEALPAGGVFFDVGMNAGFYTFWSLSLQRPGLRVVSVEPGPTMLERVRHNLAQNELSDFVTLNACAATAEPCEVVIETHARNLGESSVRAACEGAPPDGRLRVPGRPLLDIAREAGVGHIDALKIDIEGHEVPVLGAFFRDAPRALWPKMIVAEIVGNEADSLRGLLLERGYRVERETKMNGILRLEK